ncbi:hypothetical protein PtB15_11B304 [Puccinia triticina]|nr:hypothetical protein PtB15_11B304 [Puccinia triticina]
MAQRRPPAPETAPPQTRNPRTGRSGSRPNLSRLHLLLRRRNQPKTIKLSLARGGRWSRCTKLSSSLLPPAPVGVVLASLAAHPLLARLEALQPTCVFLATPVIPALSVRLEVLLLSRVGFVVLATPIMPALPARRKALQPTRSVLATPVTPALPARREALQPTRAVLATPVMPALPARREALQPTRTVLATPVTPAGKPSSPPAPSSQHRSSLAHPEEAEPGPRQDSSDESEGKTLMRIASGDFDTGPSTPLTSSIDLTNAGVNLNRQSSTPAPNNIKNWIPESSSKTEPKNTLESTPPSGLPTPIKPSQVSEAAPHTPLINFNSHIEGDDDDPFIQSAIYQLLSTLEWPQSAQHMAIVPTNFGASTSAAFHVTTIAERPTSRPPMLSAQDANPLPVHRAILPINFGASTLAERATRIPLKVSAPTFGQAASQVTSHQFNFCPVALRFPDPMNLAMAAKDDITLLFPPSNLACRL